MHAHVCVCVCLCERCGTCPQKSLFTAIINHQSKTDEKMLEFVKTHSTEHCIFHEIGFLVKLSNRNFISKLHV